ncbi:hypothetical protein SLA2020_044470 [Shorea laevis]
MEGWQYTRDQSSMAQILSKMSNCGALLMNWGEARLWIGSIPQQIKNLQEELQWIRDRKAEDNSLEALERTEQANFEELAVQRGD